MSVWEFSPCVSQTVIEAAKLDYCDSTFLLWTPCSHSTSEKETRLQSRTLPTMLTLCSDTNNIQSKKAILSCRIVTLTQQHTFATVFPFWLQRDHWQIHKSQLFVHYWIMVAQLALALFLLYESKLEKLKYTNYIQIVVCVCVHVKMWYIWRTKVFNPSMCHLWPFFVPKFVSYILWDNCSC